MKKFTALFIGIIFTASAAQAIEAGVKAPDFKTTDINGNAQSISQYKGKVVVLEWNNPECPYVRKFYDGGNMQGWQQQATKDGVIWLTINSGAESKQGYMNAEAAKQNFSDKKLASTAYIIDENGTIGKAYGAASTPTVIVINKKGNVEYFGAIDDKPSSKPEDIATARNYLAEAITAAKESRKAAVPATKSYGCGVKYAQ